MFIIYFSNYFQKKWYACPDCPVVCSREDFLLDHIHRKHVLNYQSYHDSDQCPEGKCGMVKSKTKKANNKRLTSVTKMCN